MQVDSIESLTIKINYYKRKTLYETFGSHNSLKIETEIEFELKLSYDRMYFFFEWPTNQMPGTSYAAPNG